MLEDAPTRQLLDAFCSAAAPPLGVEVRAATPYSELKRTFADLDPREDPDVTPRTRSELFEAPMRAATLASLLSAFADRPPSEGRQLTFLAMGGAYGRVAGRRHGLRPPARAVPASSTSARGPQRGSTGPGRSPTRTAPGASTPTSRTLTSSTGPGPTTAATPAAWLASSAPTTPTGSSTSRSASNPTPRRTRDHSAVHVDVPGRLHRRPRRPRGPGARPRRRAALQLARRTRRSRHQRAGVRRGPVDRRHHLRPSYLRARGPLER